MHTIHKITEEMDWIGGNDRRISIFEAAFPVRDGMSYNAYLVKDEKSVLFNAVDQSVAEIFFENLEVDLAGRKLDYVVIQHMEPDHSASLSGLLLRHPEAKVVMNAKIASMIAQFYQPIPLEGALIVKEGDTLTTGKHTFHFINAPMVHWPEVMVVYDDFDKALYSADAFGSFGALSGAIFADQYAFNSEILPESRRYYTNIVGKYGAQVQALLKKVKGLEIKLICPLHSHVYRKELAPILEKYDLWSRYEPEEKGVLLVYASVYGNTANAAEALAQELDERGVKVKMFDVACADESELLAQAFRFSHLVLALATINGGLLASMRTFLDELVAHNLQKRTIALIENGSWAASAARQVKEILSTLKGMTFLEETVSFKSRLHEDQRAELKHLAEAIACSVQTK